MKIKVKIGLTGLVSLILLTVLLIFDFFPNYLFFNYLNNGYFFWSLLIALAAVISFDSKRLEYKNTFHDFLLPVFIVFLLLILTIVGGSSIHGLSATQGSFWIIVAFCIIDIISLKNRKKTKES